MSVEKCGICNKSVRPNNSHFCQVCETWSHAKCNSIESKNIRNVWLCKLCRSHIFPFADGDSGTATIGNNLSGLKAYFSQLNNLTSFGSIDHDEDQDESFVNITALMIFNPSLKVILYLFCI